MDSQSGSHITTLSQKVTPSVSRVGRITLIALILATGLISTARWTAAQDNAPPPYVPPEDISELSGDITIDGSSTVFPATADAAERFVAEHADNVRFTIEFSGTSGGFARFCDGDTDVQNASRPINETEIAQCQDNGVEYFVFQIGVDGISIVVNEANDWVDCLTVEQLASVWRERRPLVNWNELNPDWPTRRMSLFGPGDQSGTQDYFREAILDGEPVTANFIPSEDDFFLVQEVANETYALGYFGYSYYAADPVGLKLVAIDSGNGCVTPAEDTILNGDYAPLSRPLFVYVKASSLWDNTALQEFLRYYIATGAEIADEVFIVPAAPETYADNLTKLEAAIAAEVAPDS